jgi:hypothetical protein
MSLTKDELEELVRAIHADTGLADNGGLTHQQVAERFLDSSWAALCHNTGRAGRFYQPSDNSPEARIYRLMYKALRETEA